MIKLDDKERLRIRSWRHLWKTWDNTWISFLHHSNQFQTSSSFLFSFKVELMLLLTILNGLKSLWWYFLMFANSWIYRNVQHVNMKHNNKFWTTFTVVSGQPSSIHVHRTRIAIWVPFQTNLGSTSSKCSQFYLSSIQLYCARLKRQAWRTQSALIDLSFFIKLGLPRILSSTVCLAFYRFHIELGLVSSSV